MPKNIYPAINAHFAVPPAQSEPANQPVLPNLDIEGILCFKERRKLAKHNTVEYHGKTLQIYPRSDRPTYARAYVELQ